MSNNICYVTLFYDIGREKWSGFTRTFEQYLEEFNPFISLFNKDKCGNDFMIVFIDEKHYDKLNVLINETVNIKLISINNSFMNGLHMWKTLEKEQSIMNKEEFKEFLGERSIYPEHLYAEYTLINHSKIDLICYLIDNNYNFEYYAWVDFGFFKKDHNRQFIPDKLLDINNFNLNCINYILLDNINIYDFDINYTLKYAPEKIGGFFFFGQKEKLKIYQKLYHDVLEWFQNILLVADDDQHLVLQCISKNPELFCLHYHGIWHAVLKFYQKK